VKAAVIAAGLGERLVADGFVQPKPLVAVAGRALIDYTLAAIDGAGLREVACIVNEQSTGIEEHCHAHWPQLRFQFVRRTTPSSMESLFTLAPLLTEKRFVLLTVDSIFAPTTLRRFLEAAWSHDDADGALALTAFVDDEKPLWARCDDDNRIVELGPAALQSGWITAGFYTFDSAVLREIEAARRAGLAALRQFLGHLVASGYHLYGEHVGKSVDVDRGRDIGTAEAFLRSGFTA